MTWLSRGVGFWDEGTGADPAAGNEATLTIPSGEFWSLESFAVTLTTDATVINRTVQVVYQFSGNLFWFSANQVNHAASTVINYYFAIGATFGMLAVNAVAGQNYLENALPENFCLGNGIIQTLTANLMGGDDFGPPEYTYRKWKG